MIWMTWNLKSEAEIVSGVRKLKSNKTTGPSRVSAALLAAFLESPYGLHVMSVMLNFILRAPEQANTEMASGWVFLVPKKACVDDAAHFRPIVCGEVYLKLAARLATARLVATWCVPSSCFGSVPGHGLRKHCASFGMLHKPARSLRMIPCLFNLTFPAFDSLHINALLQFFVQNWPGLFAKSSLLRWALLHSDLRFEIFDVVWWCCTSGAHNKVDLIALPSSVG